MLRAKYSRLRAILTDMGDLIIGMSGGVDSVLLAKVAHEVLGERPLAVTADSPSLPRRELREAEELAHMNKSMAAVISVDDLLKI
jgi:uncharacterized protein